MVFRQITQPMPSTWRAIAITVGRVYAPTMKPMMASQKNQLLATGLPRHLAALVGALNGPSDLGRNHDKYLSYPDREEGSGAASA